MALNIVLFQPVQELYACEWEGGLLYGTISAIFTISVIMTDIVNLILLHYVHSPVLVEYTPMYMV